MTKFKYALFACLLAIFCVACEKSLADKINGTWKSVDAGDYFKVLLTIDTKAKTGELSKYDGDEIVATHKEQIANTKIEGNSVFLTMKNADGSTSEIVLTFENDNKLLLSGSGANMEFTRLKK